MIGFPVFYETLDNGRPMNAVNNLCGRNTSAGTKEVSENLPMGIRDCAAVAKRVRALDGLAPRFKIVVLDTSVPNTPFFTTGGDFATPHRCGRATPDIGTDRLPPG